MELSLSFDSVTCSLSESALPCPAQFLGLSWVLWFTDQTASALPTDWVLFNWLFSAVNKNESALCLCPSDLWLSFILLYIFCIPAHSIVREGSGKESERMTCSVTCSWIESTNSLDRSFWAILLWTGQRKEPTIVCFTYPWKTSFSRDTVSSSDILPRDPTKSRLPICQKTNTISI